MRATTGERPSFEDRFAPLAALAYKVAYRLTGDRAESEDLAQEALARAYLRWRKVARYDEAWVARVVTNLAIGRWRRHGRVEVRGDWGDRGRPAAAHPRPDDPLDRIEVVRALRSLPRRQREAVALRYLADLPEAAVAAHLGCTVGAVKQHTHRGLAALRRADGRQAHDEERTDVRASR
ncbi:MAG TPA: sigma-70 family RNA polymerase sigma factor [Acidimicrobiales bacterium]|nr:sigma-70 family RNA polymerase sigma factor [Acidimicrobiales bacterium]